jgi:predicted dehydrogenase
MTYEDAERLVELADANGLSISGAPCSLLGTAAQTLWRAVRERVIGDVRLIYAELDDGMIHRMPYRKWRSVSGARWPYKDEFEVGCTLEHAGYYLTWLTAMFGPVVSVMAQSRCVIADKVPGERLDPADSPDCSFGVLKFQSGVLARLSTTIVAPHDHSMRIVGDDGVLRVKDCWFNDAKVHVNKLIKIRRKTLLSPISRTYRLPGAPHGRLRRTGGSRMDFAAGVAELAESVIERRRCRLSSRFALHTTEVALALHHAGDGTLYLTRSRFEPIEPLDWSVA